MGYDNWEKWQFQRCLSCGKPIKPKIGDKIHRKGDIILDCMAGCGSIMIAALSGCRLLCIDTSPGYAELLEKSKASVLQHAKDADITVLYGDCVEFLPLPVDHICFSPPYTDIMKKLKITEHDIWGDALNISEEEAARYSQGKGNLGLVPEFYHMQAMEKILAKCLLSLEPKGTMTLITKDHMEAGRRIHLTRKYIKAAERIGFKLTEAFKREALGTMFAQVKDEDISIFVRKD